MPLKKMIKISDKAHKMLREIGTKDETFSDIIVRLAVFYKEHKKWRLTTVDFFVAPPSVMSFHQINVNDIVNERK